MKQGLRAKFYNHEWNPAEFKIPLSPDRVFESKKRYLQGFSLERKEFTEAAAVWNEKSFRKVGDLLYAGGYFVVRGKLAEVLSRFNLGEGGLIPFPIYKADLETPYPGEFFLLNFGCRKDTVVEGISKNIIVRGIQKSTGIKLLRVNSRSRDNDIALSGDALRGSDIWFEERIDNKIFMSDALGQALIDIGMKDVFALEECRIVEGPQ